MLVCKQDLQALEAASGTGDVSADAKEGKESVLGALDTGLHTNIIILGSLNPFIPQALHMNITILGSRSLFFPGSMSCSRIPQGLIVDPWQLHVTVSSYPASIPCAATTTFRTANIC
eukprot:1160336-Pelagomonas_calceolata.AAC.14